MLASLLSPDMVSIVYAVVAAIFGYWLKHQSGTTVPPELTDVVNLLIQRNAAAQTVQAHSTLQTLSSPIANIVHQLDAVLTPTPATSVTVPATAPAK